MDGLQKRQSLIESQMGDNLLTDLLSEKAYDIDELTSKKRDKEDKSR